MTLIIGTVLPRGILLVSDTRSTYTMNGEIASDLKKKILSITPSLDLAGSGSESNWYTSKILRDCLYNTIFLDPFKYSSIEIRNKILETYRQVNSLYQFSHPNGDPVGQLLLAEFENATGNFNLLHQCGSEGFNTFNIFNNVNDVEVIGGTLEIRNSVKLEVNLALERLSYHILSHDGGFITVADLCHEIIKKQPDKAIGGNIYCSYLTHKDGIPQHSRFFIKENGEEYFFNEDDGLEKIIYQDLLSFN